MDIAGNSPENRLPDIRENETPSRTRSTAPNSASSTAGHSSSGASCSGVSAASLAVHAPSTPRIDISRASSSSHQDSRDSSPENVFEQVSVCQC